eukprot:5418292-Prymnesium_polylepis.1
MARSEGKGGRNTPPEALRAPLGCRRRAKRPHERAPPPEPGTSTSGRPQRAGGTPRPRAVEAWRKGRRVCAHALAAFCHRACIRARGARRGAPSCRTGPFRSAAPACAPHSPRARG